MSHISRMRKKFGSAESVLSSQYGSGYIPQSKHDVLPSLNDWMMILGTVNECGANIELMRAKYGDLPFAVAITIFHEMIPESVMVYVERMRYQNTILKEKTGIIKRFQGL